MPAVFALIRGVPAPEYLQAPKLLRKRKSLKLAGGLLSQSIVPLIVAFCLGLVHVFAGKLRFLNVLPRSRWLSFAGGTSVAYVFVHLLPELEKYQNALQPADGAMLSFLDHHVYLIALTGLAVFYGIERSTKESRKETRDATGKDVPSMEMFWFSILSFGLYTGLIGYLLVSESERSGLTLLFFSGAIALHFIVNDYGLREHHKHLYTLYGRWVLLVAITAGAIAGILIEIDKVPLAIMISFLSGGIILNVLKEELPDNRESRFTAFALGAIVYAILLMIS
jgi:hypothetical protein